jgi:hypothetical protein
MDNFDELFSRAAGWLFVIVGVDQVRPDVVLEHDSQQAVHRAAATGDLLQYVDAPTLVFERSLDRSDLTLDTADSVEQLLFLANGMTHG